MQKHTIDASGKKLGRLATEVAVLLMGKNRTDFAKNTIPDVSVEVLNAKSIDIDQKKILEKNYYTHSGYPGSLKTESMSQVIDKKGRGEVLRKAILGMLPKNKLRPRMIKRLTITE